MIKVSNRKCIRNLSQKSLRANRARNRIAIAAIALTTLLFTALFTIGMTIVNSFEQATFRQVGGSMHGGFKYLTEEQALELAQDPLITQYGMRLLLGMPSEPPFNKAHVEVSYMDNSCAELSFCTPSHGTYPQEGTNQLACDTRVLSLLGIKPEIGAEITMPYVIGDGNNKKNVEDTFTLSGWWEYDPASVASQVLVPRSYADQVLADFTPQKGDLYGTWTLNVNFKNAYNIENNLNTVLANYGYQNENPPEENYIATGVNWAYMGAQFSQNIDFGTIFALLALILLIIFTGYLIIYNIFQISVIHDIQFYGLLKTIGVTSRQLRFIVRRQALALSLFGIPIGLLLGWFGGVWIAPAVMQTLSYTRVHASVHPAIFLFATLFSLITVLISSRKPGRVAGRVSPVEAIRYTEGGKTGRKNRQKHSKKGAKIPHMAFANLGRNKRKTVLVVLSLSLSVVLLQATYTFAIGFDMDKYLSQWVVTDFIVGNADYFQTGAGFRSTDQAVPESVIQTINEQGGIAASGRIYGQTSFIQEFVTEDWYRAAHGKWNSEETLDILLQTIERTPDGRVADNAQLYGMEKLAFDKLTVVEGDLAPLYDPTQNAIAAIYDTDDYGALYEDSNWANPGDKITLRYVDEFEYYDVRTGEVKDPEQIERGYVGQRTKKYHDVTYTVAACITMKHPMSYRYYGSDQFVLNAEVFQRDTGTSNIMTYLFNTTPETNHPMEQFLADYTEKVEPTMDYESKQSYVNEFNSTRNMFLLLGGVLSLVIGLIGALNFLNAILTSILTRQREFAVLQAVGMTGKQLKHMLMCEGLIFSGFAVFVSLLISFIMGPLMQNTLSSMFWFFTYRFSLLPVLCIAPIFLLFGLSIPVITYHFSNRQSIVDRIRAEA